MFLLLAKTQRRKEKKDFAACHPEALRLGAFARPPRRIFFSRSLPGAGRPACRQTGRRDAKEGKSALASCFLHLTSLY